MNGIRPGDDGSWRPPAEGSAAPAHGSADPADRPVSGASPSGYTGPPRAAPPPPGWRTPVVVQPGSPRALPRQDPARLDAEEQSARTLTYGVAMVAGAVMVLLILVLCGRTLF